MKKQIILLALMLLPMMAGAEPVLIDGIYYNLVSKIKEAEVTNRTGGNSDGRKSYSGIVVIPDSITYDGVDYDVTSIGQQAFFECSSLTSVTIPNSVTRIGDSAFRSCSGLITVTIPNSVTSIGTSAFDSCSGLTSIIIPSSITSIGSWAFHGCSGLTSITIPNSVTNIDEYTFDSCSGLTSITIPNSVTSIGFNAFGICSSLTSLKIGSGVKNIALYAFVNCMQLADIYCLAENVPSTDTQAFAYSPIGRITLHVPAASVKDYKAVEPWKSFKNIVPLIDKSMADVNGDNVVDVADIGTIIDVMAAGDKVVEQVIAADVNKDGVVDVADIATIIDIMAGK